ncbi:primosomal protein N' [Microbacterium sp. YY-01]|uniref:primosomal protein N' family DNA-binding protein n=1 Tax=Microbacterium sp. YY-01 TaxID=3421634 RepID=UPI003D179C2B
MVRRIARVMLDSPLPQLDRLFDYELTEEQREQARPGLRVRVPLRTAGRLVDGFIISCDDEADDTRVLAAVETVVSDVPVLPKRLYTLARRLADRAAGSAIDIVRLAVPKRHVRVEKDWRAGGEPEPIPLDDAVVHRSYEVLGSYGDLDQQLRDHTRVAVEAVPQVDSQGRPLWASLFAAIAVATLDRGQSSILVVPDHRDLTMLRSVLSEWLDEAVIVRVDAGQSNVERYRAYLRTLDDAPCVVVGNRSAVYSPVRAGVIAVWDEGDSLLAEPLAPYVHARDAALIRQEQEDSALIFAAHARSTDIERLVSGGWMSETTAQPRRPSRVVLDAGSEIDKGGQRIPSRAFTTAREAAREGPVLIQVARPGFAPSLVCAQCRAPSRCLHCAGPLQAAYRGAVPSCGWCARPAHAWECTHCQSHQFRWAASGSQRTAEELGRAFAGTRVIVSDGDHPVEQVDARPSLVVATRGAEPIAEGGYRAVVLLDGARMLQAPQLRIGESCLRWWANAAALAAPGATVHLVGVDGPVARALATANHAAYLREELRTRAPLMMPPTARTATLEGTPRGIERAREALENAGVGRDGFLGPVPVDSADGTERLENRERLLVRFPYAAGERVATALRGAVIAEASGSRRGRGKNRKTTLTVRLDSREPDL